MEAEKNNKGFETSLEHPSEALGEKDFFLQNLVDDTNQFPANQIGVTLLIGGLLVSGTIISGDEYFRLCAKSLAPEGTDVHDIFTSYGDHYKADRETGKSDKITSYIHLADCTFHGPTSLAGLNVLWRGLISSVDGFFIGTLVTEAPNKKTP